MELQFHTGKPDQVASQTGSNSLRRRSTKVEFTLLALAFSLSLIPYGVFFWFQPIACIVVVLFLAFFNVMMTFISSAQTDTSHHIRFLLAGSNPIGMTGGSSLLLGAVDSVLDWREDSLARKKSPASFGLTTLVKFLSTPIGFVLMMSEFLWDVLLLRRSPRIVILKLDEFFSLARYHNIICPEKSNDIFYADMAFARYRNDPYHYQWVRLRSMVFELQHYQIDVEDGIGVPSTNLFLQSEIEAYQILRRLRMEELEYEVANYYEQNADAFIVPPKLTGALIRNARPIFHYQRMRNDLTKVSKRPQSEAETALANLAGKLHAAISEDGQPPQQTPFSTWHLLRLLDQHGTATRYLPEAWIQRLATNGFLRIKGDKSWNLSDKLRRQMVEILDRFFEPTPKELADARLVSQRPNFLWFEDQLYSPK